MAIKGGRGRGKGPTQPKLPQIKLFRPISWYDGITLRSSTDYISHILFELGRWGLKVADIERHDRPPNTQTVLSDLLDWLADHPGEAYAKLVDWQALDFSHMRSRLERDRNTKPRIELTAHITKMNNLSVRWYPGGWREADYDWSANGRDSYNLIKQRKWTSQPDFHWFTGDEEPTFNSRSSNELMYIRGVGNLRPEPRESYGPYAAFNSDVVASLLICAVRSAYEGLIRQLEHSFEIDVLDMFDFVTREEVIEGDVFTREFPVDRVVSWSLEDTKQLRERQAQRAALKREEQARAELADVGVTHGFTLEQFATALTQATTKKVTGPAPSSEQINRNAAKYLRDGGFKVDAGDVRRLRGHLENYMTDILPEPLRPQSSPPPLVTRQAADILRFPSADDGGNRYRLYQSVSSQAFRIASETPSIWRASTTRAKSPIA